MRFARIVGFFFMPAALGVKLPLDALRDRQDGCSVYGDYPEYTGPCKDTSKITHLHLNYRGKWMHTPLCSMVWPYVSDWIQHLYDNIWSTLIDSPQIVVPKVPTVQKLLKVA